MNELTKEELCLMNTVLEEYRASKAKNHSHVEIEWDIKNGQCVKLWATSKRDLGEIRQNVKLREPNRD